MPIHTQQADTLNFTPREIACDEVLSELNGSDIINLFQSIASEFGNGDIQYSFDSETASVLLAIDGITSSISVADIDPYATWTANSASDFIALRAMITVPVSTLNKLNQLHPNTKFYSCDTAIIAEEAFYLSHGVASLNLLDRFSAFLNTIRSLNA